MGVSQFWDAVVEMEKQPRGFDDPTYRPPRGHDKELSDHERACRPHSESDPYDRKKMRHGQDAIGRIPHVKGA